MSWTPCKIADVSFSATVSTGGVAPLAQTFPVFLPLTFSNVANVSVYNGIYTPANDYLYLFQGLPLALTPNFLWIVTDGHLNVSRAFSNAGTPVENVTRFFFADWVSDGGNYLASLYLEGRTGVVHPMTQGVAVSYSVVCGQAVVS